MIAYTVPLFLRGRVITDHLVPFDTRVGAAQKAQLEQLGLHVIDASQEGWGVVNHDLFLSDGRIRQVIRRAVDSPTGA